MERKNYSCLLCDISGKPDEQRKKETEKKKTQNSFHFI